MIVYRGHGGRNKLKLKLFISSKKSFAMNFVMKDKMG